MAVEERRRIALHRAAAETWGEEVANTLVDLVAPSGHELATREDIQGVLTAMAAMDERIDARFQSLEVRWDARFGALEERWDGSGRWRSGGTFGVLETGRGGGREVGHTVGHGRHTRVGALGERIEALDGKWETRFGALEERIEALDGKWEIRFGALEERIEALDERWDARIDGLRHELLSALDRRIADAVTLQTRTLVLSQLVALVVIAGLAFGLR
jgi:hypothetical protein